MEGRAEGPIWGAGETPRGGQIWGVGGRSQSVGRPRGGGQIQGFGSR